MNQPDKIVKSMSEIRDAFNQFALSPSAASPPPVIPYPGVVTNGSDEVHLRDYWNAVRKRLWLVISIAMLVTLLTAISMARKPDIYETQARVQVDLENASSSLGGAGNSSVIISNPVHDPAYFNTQLQVLTGPGLLRRVAKTLDLEHNEAFFRPQAIQNRSTWQSLLIMFGLGKREGVKNPAMDEVPVTSAVAPATSRDDLVEAKRLLPYVRALQAGLRVEPVKDNRLAYRDTRLIDIRFTHNNPQIAAKVVNAIADTFVLSNKERRAETNTTTGDFLQKRIAELQSQIRTGEERLINYAKSNQILSLDASQNTVVERLTGLNKQLLEAENDRKLAESAFRASLAPGAAVALADADAKQIAEAESKLADLRQQRVHLLVENTEEWPDVKDINQQIAELEKRVNDVRSRATSTVITNLETRYRQASMREQSLRADFNQQRNETLAQNEAAVNYRIIQQEIQTYKTLLDGLLQRSKENDVVLAGIPNNIYVVDYALASDVPVGPKRMRSVMLALVLSLAFGVGLAILLEYLDDTLHSADDVEKMLRLPALAVIPATGGLASRLRPVSGALQRSVNDNPELLINADARSPLAEAYRQLRTSVLLSTPGRAPRTLLVTSSMPSEGKTTTSVNVALSLAQTGANVLIIDGDMRRPRLHSIFGVKNSRGLSTILSREVNQAEMLSMIEQMGSSGLYFLTSGPIPPNPAELLGSEQMRRLISSMECHFTHIVIDSPPTASFTDSVLISSMVDGVLLVVHGGKSSRDVVRRAQQMLQDVGAKIFGVVLNNFKLRPTDYYYYRGLYQEYYNKDEPDSDRLASTT